MLTGYCHSTCGTCSVANDASQCLSCSSALSSLAGLSLPFGQTVGSCTVPMTSNAQMILTVNKNTVLGTSELKSITYNGATVSTSGQSLSALTSLYTNNVIEFMSLSINKVTLTFGDLPSIHKKLIVRARVITECSVENRTLQMTLLGDTAPTIKTFTLTPST